MKPLHAALLIAVVTTSAAQAGTLQKFGLNIKATIGEDCNATLCTQSIKLKGSMSSECTITPAEISSFTASTVLSLQPGILGSDSEWALGDDPTYDPGDTSVSFTEESPEAGGTITIVTSFSWGDGKIHMTRSIKGKGSTTIAHPTPSGALSAIFPGSNKDHQEAITEFDYVLEAKNGDTVVYQTEALLLPDVRQAQITTSKASEGLVDVTVQANIKCKEFLLP